MPTYYTDRLLSKKNLKMWLKEDIVRALGICVSLRDNGPMTQLEVEKALAKEGVPDYHEQRLEELIAEKNIFEGKSDTELLEIFTAEQKNSNASYVAHCDKYERDKYFFSKMLDKIDKVIILANDEISLGALKYAKEQIKLTLDHDYSIGIYRPAVIDYSFAEWKDTVFKRCHSGILYHSGKIAEKSAKLEKGSRLKSYKTFIEFIDTNMEDES